MRESPAERGILSYYERYDEQGRLGRGSGALEFARMQDLIGRFLAPPPGVILDVGGGPGRVEQEETLLGAASHIAAVAVRDHSASTMPSV